MEWRERLGESAQKAAHGIAAAAVVNHDLLEIDVAYGGRLHPGDCFELVHNHQTCGLVGVTPSGADYLAQSIGHLGQDLHAPHGLPDELGAQGLALGFAREDFLLLFALGFGAHAVPFDLRRHDDVGVFRGAVAFRAGDFRLLLGDIAFLFGRCRLHGVRRVAPALGFRLRFPQVGLGGSLHSLGLVLAEHGLGVGFCDADSLLLHRPGGAHGAIALLLGNLHLGLVDRFRRRPLTQGLYISRLVGDIRDVDVDELQADLRQLGLDVLQHPGLELLAVAIDLLDIHHGDGGAQLAVYDVLGRVFDLGRVKRQQPLRGVVHQFLDGTDAEGEAGRHVDADVLFRQRTAQVDVHRHRLQIKIAEALHHRHDKRCAAMDGLGHALTTHLPILDEDLVRRTGSNPAHCRDRGNHEQHY